MVVKANSLMTEMVSYVNIGLQEQKMLNSMKKLLE